MRAPDRKLKLNVKLGDKDYPLADAKNPGTVAQMIRANLTDDKRSVRLYGSLVVLARLTGIGRPSARAVAQLRGRGTEGRWPPRARARGYTKSIR